MPTFPPISPLCCFLTTEKPGLPGGRHTGRGAPPVWQSRPQGRARLLLHPPGWPHPLFVPGVPLSAPQQPWWRSPQWGGHLPQGRARSSSGDLRGGGEKGERGWACGRRRRRRKDGWALALHTHPRPTDFHRVHEQHRPRPNAPPRCRGPSARLLLPLRTAGKEEEEMMKEEEEAAMGSAEARPHGGGAPSPQPPPPFCLRLRAEAARERPGCPGGKWPRPEGSCSGRLLGGAGTRGARRRRRAGRFPHPAADRLVPGLAGAQRHRFPQRLCVCLPHKAVVFPL